LSRSLRKWGLNLGKKKGRVIYPEKNPLFVHTREKQGGREKGP